MSKSFSKNQLITFSKNVLFEKQQYRNNVKTIFCLLPKSIYCYIIKISGKTTVGQGKLNVAFLP